jgi:hypothetical protein
MRYDNAVNRLNASILTKVKRNFTLSGLWVKFLLLTRMDGSAGADAVGAAAAPEGEAGVAARAAEEDSRNAVKAGLGGPRSKNLEKLGSITALYYYYYFV